MFKTESAGFGRLYFNNDVDATLNAPLVCSSLKALVCPPRDDKHLIGCGTMLGSLYFKKQWDPASMHKRSTLGLEYVLRSNYHVGMKRG